MRNIWTVFKTDIRTLSKCFFACVVVVAIALLPSLYAWLNIYSNWDPYGNTGGISIAVASLDEKSTMFRKQQRPAVGRKYKPMIEGENS